MNKRSDRDVFAALFVGAAAGAITALLFAPDTGKRTRRRIRRHAEDSADSIAGAGRNLIENCEDLYRRSSQLADEGARELSDKYGDLLKRSKQLVAETRTVIGR